MPAHLTPAQARALGVDVPASSGAGRRTRKAAPGHGVSRCATCGETFTTDAAEDRHVTAGHNRFETVVSAETPETPETPPP